MKKELFIESMNALQKQREHDTECAKAFKVILPDDYTSVYDNHAVVSQLTKILKVYFNDDDKDSMIDYFIDELDFGKKYYDGCLRTKDDVSIDISTIELLYEYLLCEDYK